MSAGSFDDSSNLVDVAASNSNGEQKGEASAILDAKPADKPVDLLDEPIDIAEEKEPEIKTKSKKSKAKKLFKRAKSPIAGAINKTTKEFKKLSNLPKHHYTVPKSPQKSPSKENLTEEYKHLEEKLGEKSKASEEWLAFQQMQDRIKQTVLKTQTSLNKYSSHSDEEDQKASTWTAFDEDMEEVIDTTLRTGPVINVSCPNNEGSVNQDSNLLDLDQPQGKARAPSPPGNSTTSGLSNMDAPVTSTEVSTSDPIDFLGLMDDAPSTDANAQSVPDTLTQGLLGLDSVLEPTPSNVSGSGDGTGTDVLSGYTFTAPSSGDTPMGATTTDNAKSDLNDILMFEKDLTHEEIMGLSAKSQKTEPMQITPESQSTPPSMFPLDAAPLEPSSTTQPVTDDFDPFSGAVPLEPVSTTSQPDSNIDPLTSSLPLQPDPVVHGDDFMEAISSTAPLEPTSATMDTAMSQAQEFETPMSSGLDPCTGVLEPVTGGQEPGTIILEPMTGILQPTSSVLEPAPASLDMFTASSDQVVPNNTVEETSVLDELATFDPMKPSPAQEIPTKSAFNPFQTVPDGQMYSTSPQMSSQSFGPVPIEHDIMSKIKRMSSCSSPNQPISPLRKSVSKPADPFGFVKKELGADEDDGSYKSMADLQKNKQQDQGQEIMEEEQTVDESLNNANNPFLSGDFAEDFPTTEISENAAAVFGVETDAFNFDTTVDTSTAAPTDDFDAFFGGADESKTKPAWTDVSTIDDANTMWADTDTIDNAGTGGVWDTNDQTDAKASGDAWGSEQTDDNVPEGGINPFQQDDFSKLEDIPVEESKEAIANPFFSGDILAPTTSTNNPFLGIDDQSTTPCEDFLGPKPVVLSDSESFFLDSVTDTQQTADGADDMFDPFKITKKEVSEPAAQQNEAAEAMDIFSPPVVSRERPSTKHSGDDHGFVLEIKPISSESSEKTSTIPAPLLKPPPKPPKSPQPPRENPFDRDSPPEENFAQFEVKEVEKPKAPPPKSISTDSTTTEEEPDLPLEPLEPFLPKLEKEGFKLMLRYPTKKKIASNRYWKNVFVKIQKQTEGPMIKVFTDANDALPMQELLLQACYSLSEMCLQQYDQYGKIHAIKLQYVFYKERVGIKTERIAPSIVKFKKREKPKATMILDHSPQVSELLKFGSLDKNEIILFMQAVEDALMNLDAHREKTLTYTKDEITAEVRDEYVAELDKFGKVLSQKARVRVFVLAFLTGMPTVDIGMNDKRRRGKEVVGRCDIIPIKTEEWIKLEDVEFHNCVDKEEFEKSNNIKCHPLDACQFELLRYRVRLRENKELPLQLTVQQIFKERKCEIRCDLLVTGYHSYSKKHGQFPCEDIEVRFPIPEQWIYMFRYERRFGYGSIHSSLRKPGKIKGLERLTMMAQGLSQTLMEADVGTAKYEHVYRSVVWRIPRLPVRNQGAYTSHLFKLKLELGPHDDIPDSFQDTTHVEFTMPCSTTSQSQIRSIAVTNPNPPEKWVRSMAKYTYTIEIEHLDEYPEFMTVGTVYKEAAKTNATEAEEENEPEERDPRLAVSDTDSSDSD